MTDVTKKYTNGEITVIWKSGVCSHSANCWKGLSNVFNPKERPWIKPDNASTDEIINQINKCPSGALSYQYNSTVVPQETTEAEFTIVVSENGPLIINGNCNLVDGNGQTIQLTNKSALCRCGASSKKPFCDGSHRKISFTG
jgi:uncharacterized Fe-S cluster protein YjdI/CDGSH-type Zn-finger protein